METKTTEEQREELEKRASLCLQMLAMERAITGHAGGDTFPLSEIYEIADKLEKLPAANPSIVHEDWEKEKDESYVLRPRRRVEMAAGLAVLAYSFSLSLENEAFLNPDRASSGPLDEAIGDLQKAAFNVIVEFGEILRQDGDLIAVGEPASPPAPSIAVVS